MRAVQLPADIPSHPSAPLPPPSEWGMARPTSVSSLGATKQAREREIPDRKKKVTIHTIKGKYEAGEKLTMVTAYDYPSARLADDSGVDMILVGDSLGMVVLGHESTVPVTVEDIVHHSQAVSRGSKRCHLIGDMPFGSYLAQDDALRNAAHILKYGNMDAVKLEGGRRVQGQIRAIHEAGILVMGHIGLTPQTATSLGGFRVQGKTTRAANDLVEDALALQDAGCYAMVLECVTDKIAAYITQLLDVPTIGIGAGIDTSGQVQVFHDLTGLFDRFMPKFSKKYTSSGAGIHQALHTYCNEVLTLKFPAAEHTFSIKDQEYEEFLKSEKLLGRGMSSVLVSSTPESSAKAAAQQSATEETVSLYGKGGSEAQQQAANAHAPVFFPGAQPLKVCCIGGGAIGSFLAARMALVVAPRDTSSSSTTSSSSSSTTSAHPLHSTHGLSNLDPLHQVWLLARASAHSHRIHTQGLHLHDGLWPSTSGANTTSSSSSSAPQHAPLRDFVTKRVRCATDPAVVKQQSDGGVDVAFIAVKGREATKLACERAAAILRPDGVALTLQNGDGNYEQLLAAVGADRAFVGTISHGVRQPQDGLVRHTGSGHIVLVDRDQPSSTSSLSSSSPSAAVLRLQSALLSAGLEAELVSGSQRRAVISAKLLVNSTINPVSALLRVPNGQLLASPPALQLLQALVAEYQQLSQRLPDRYPVPAQPWEHVRRVLDATADNHSSMLVDVLHHRFTELDVITGGLLEAAQAHGIAMPTHSTLYQLIKGLEAAYPHMVPDAVHAASMGAAAPTSSK